MGPPGPLPPNPQKPGSETPLLLSSIRSLTTSGFGLQTIPKLKSDLSSHPFPNPCPRTLPIRPVSPLRQDEVIWPISYGVVECGSWIRCDSIASVRGSGGSFVVARTLMLYACTFCRWTKNQSPWPGGLPAPPDPPGPQACRPEGTEAHQTPFSLAGVLTPQVPGSASPGSGGGRGGQ